MLPPANQSKKPLRAVPAASQQAFGHSRNIDQLTFNVQLWPNEACQPNADHQMLRHMPPWLKHHNWSGVSLRLQLENAAGWRHKLAAAGRSDVRYPKPGLYRYPKALHVGYPCTCKKRGTPSHSPRLYQATPPRGLPLARQNKKTPALNRLASHQVEGLTVYCIVCDGMGSFFHFGGPVSDARLDRPFRRNNMFTCFRRQEEGKKATH